MAKKEKKMMRRRLANAYVSSVVSISLVLLLVGIASLLIVNAREVSDYFKENMLVSVILKQEADDDAAEEYASTLLSKPFVNTVKPVSREQGTRELQTMLGEDFLSVFEASPVPVSVDVTLKAAYVSPDSLSMVTAALADSPLVDEVSCQQSLVEALNANLKKISLVLGGFILVLLFISFVLINNTVRINVFARRFTIHTMKLVGATRAFIRRPFIRAAVLQGLVSAAVAAGVLNLGLFLLRRSFPELLAVVDTKGTIVVCGIVVAAGVLICVVSTFCVVGRLVGTDKDELYY